MATTVFRASQHRTILTAATFVTGAGAIEATAMTVAWASAIARTRKDTAAHTSITRSTVAFTFGLVASSMSAAIAANVNGAICFKVTHVAHASAVGTNTVATAILGTLFSVTVGSFPVGVADTFVSSLITHTVAAALRTTAVHVFLTCRALEAWVAVACAVILAVSMVAARGTRSCGVSSCLTTGTGLGGAIVAAETVVADASGPCALSVPVAIVQVLAAFRARTVFARPSRLAVTCTFLAGTTIRTRAILRAEHL